MNIKKISAALIAAAMFTAAVPISVSAEDNGGLIEGDNGGFTEQKLYLRNLGKSEGIELVRVF